MERVRLLFFWLVVLIIPGPSLLGSPPDSSTRDEFTVFQENGKVGLKDRDGQVLIPASYEAIGWSNGNFSIVDKVVGYQSNGLWGIINTSNRVITPPEFAELHPGEGSFLIAKMKSGLSARASFGVVSTGGKTVIPFLYDALQISNMRAIVMSRNGARFYFGLLDLSNREIIPIRYQRIYSIGSLRYAVENFEDKTAIFSDDGTPLTPFLIDSISSFRKNFAIVYEGQRQGLINRNGEMVVQPTYAEIRFADDGAIEGRELNTWLLLDGEDNVISEQHADFIAPLSASRYAVGSAGNVRLTDNRFEPVLPTLFSFIETFHNGLARYGNGGHTGVLDETGRIIVPAEYRDVVIGNEWFIARTETHYRNGWVLLDAAGKVLTPKHYEYIGPNNGIFYPVRNKGYWGAVDRTGREIIACVHDSLVQNDNRHIVVKFRSQYGIINLSENWVVTPRPNRLQLLNEDTYFEFAGQTTFLKSLSGGIIYFSDNPLEFKGDHLRETLSSGGYWIIDLNGTITDRSDAPEGTEQVFAAHEGLRAIRRDGKYGFIDEQGRLRIANRYEEVKPFCEGMAAIRIMNKWGFIDKAENLIVQPVYDEVRGYHNGMAVVKQDGVTGLVNKNGKVVLPPRYDEIFPNSHAHWVLQQRGLYGLANEEGTVIVQPRYDTLAEAGDGFVIVRRNGKSGLLTLEGVPTVPMIYDDLSYDPLHGHYIALKKSPWKTLHPATVSEGR